MTRRPPPRWRLRETGGDVQLETMYSTVENETATVTLNRADVLNCAN
jgi:hypothetical protein